MKLMGFKFSMCLSRFVSIGVHLFFLALGEVGFVVKKSAD